MVWRRVAIFVTEQAKQRAADPFRQIDGRHWLGARQFRRIVDYNIAAPAIDSGIDIGDPGCGEIRLSASRAEANHANLSVAIALRAKELDRPRYIAYDLVIGHTASGACAGHDFFQRTITQAEVQIRGNCGIAVMCEFARHFRGPFIPTGKVMDHNDARKPPRTGGMRVICFPTITIRPLEGNHLCPDASKRHGDLHYSLDSLTLPALPG
jgi:hypothetical protein